MQSILLQLVISGIDPHQMEAETTSRAASLLMSGWESSVASSGAGSSVWGWSRVIAPALHEGAHAPPCQRSLHVAAVLRTRDQY